MTCRPFVEGHRNIVTHRDPVRILKLTSVDIDENVTAAYKTKLMTAAWDHHGMKSISADPTLHKS
jgi:hypothetical protein